MCAPAAKLLVNPGFDRHALADVLGEPDVERVAVSRHAEHIARAAMLSRLNTRCPGPSEPPIGDHRDGVFQPHG
jgi:hypothetical protein